MASLPNLNREEKICCILISSGWTREQIKHDLVNLYGVPAEQIPALLETVEVKTKRKILA